MMGCAEHTCESANAVYHQGPGPMGHGVEVKPDEAHELQIKHKTQTAGNRIFDAANDSCALPTGPFLAPKQLASGCWQRQVNGSISHVGAGLVQKQPHA